MTCGPAELRRPSTFYYRHTLLDAVCLLRCCAPIRTPAPSNFHPAVVTHFVPGINPQLEYLCTTGSTHRCGHLHLVTPRRPAVVPSSFDIHVSADMTACPWKLNHGDHHASCFYHCHTHTRFPRCCSYPRHDVPRRGHGSSDVAFTALPYLSFADRWDPCLWVPHVSDRMVGLFKPLIPLGPTAPLPLCA